jgi:hypothetical protein
MKKRLNMRVVLASVSALVLGVQVAALAQPFDSGWIFGSQCFAEGKTGQAYIDCLDAKCRNAFIGSGDPCAWYGCHNGGVAWYEWNYACQQCVHILACPAKDAD